MSLSIDESYAYCTRLARQAASNFYYTFRLLSTPKRQAMLAIYAYLRELDEIADGQTQTNITSTSHTDTLIGQVTLKQELPELDVRELTWLPTDQVLPQNWSQLASWRRLQSARLQFEQALAGDIRGPVLPAVMDTIQRFGIPAEYFTAMMDGMAMDLLGREYQTWEQLSEYCYHVASVVGLICLHVWGFRDAAAFEPAQACGLAFQLTNILRDLGEDTATGRMYLPQVELQQFNCTMQDFQQRTNHEQIVALMQFQGKRAQDLFDQAVNLGPYLERDGRRIYAAMHETYRQLLEKILRDPTRVLSERIRVRRWQKLWIACRAWWTSGQNLVSSR